MPRPRTKLARIMKRTLRAKRSLCVEHLESRRLLAVAIALQGSSVTFSGDRSDDFVSLRVGRDNLLEYSTGGATFSNDLDPRLRGNQTLTLNSDASILVNLDGGNDRLQVGGSLDKSGATTAYAGGSGTDELVAGDITNTWTISEPDRGTLNIRTSFSDVEILSGGSSLDQFQVLTQEPFDRNIFGRGGRLTITGTSLHITGDIIDSAEIDVTAEDRLVVSQGAIISTRQVGRDGDPRTSPSVDSSSDISLTSPDITIDGNAAILAHSIGRHRAGNVTIVASRANEARASADALSSVFVENATVTGGNISIQADSRVNAEDMQTGTQFGATASLVAGKSSATVEIVGESIITGSGDVLIGAESNLASQTTSVAAATGNPALDAAIALADLESMAIARLGGRSRVTAAGNFELVARSDIDARTAADGEAGGANAAGTTLATTSLDNMTVASVEDAASVSAKSALILAQTKEDVSTTSVGTAQGATQNTDGVRTNLEKYQATTASGDLGIASALSINDIDTVTQAFISSGDEITSAGVLDVRSLARNNHNSRADSTGVNSKFAGGAAVAVNVSDKRNESFVAGAPTLASSDITVATGMPVDPDRVSTFRAESFSGVGSDSVGIAGAISINVVNNQSRASLAEEARATVSGNIVFRAEDQSESISNSQPLDPSERDPLFGIGSSLAVNLVEDATIAELERNAGLSSARHISLRANSDHDVTTTSSAGASGGIVLTPGIAITNTNLDTAARIGAGPTVTASGNIAVEATHDGQVTTIASGDSVADAVGLGTNLAINIAHHNADATVARGLATGGDIVIATDSNSQSDAIATAGQNGAVDDVDRRDVSQELGQWFTQVDSLIRNFGLPLPTPGPPTAQVFEDPVDVAAAVAVNVADSHSNARITSLTPVASSATITIDSNGLVSSTATADGSAVRPGTTIGVGTAVALNVATAVNEAYVDNGSQIVADDLIVHAGLPLAIDRTVAHEFAARSTSGPGDSSVAVAGSLAINAVNNRTEAAIGERALVQMTGSDIQIISQNMSNSYAQAGSQAATDGTLGVGASVAVNLVNNETQAQLGKSVDLAGADQLDVKAIAAHAITTESDAGAAGAVATTPAVALEYGTSQTHVVIEEGPALSLSGDLNADTSHQVTTVTRASGLGAGAVVELGASLSVAATQSVADVIVKRDVSAIGNIRLATNAATPSGTLAVASMRGAEGEERATARDGVNQLINDAIDYAAGLARPLRIASQVIQRPSAETDEGFVSVASAIAVNIANTIADVSIADGVQLATVRGLTISSSNNTDNTVSADGSPVATDARVQFGIGASVAINVSNSLNNATIGKNANVAAGTALISAAPIGRDRQNRTVVEAISGAGATNLGVAGALAINVSNNQANAVLDEDSSLVLDRGDLRLVAENRAENIVRSHPMNESDVGLGASIAVNILGNGTYADVKNGTAIGGVRDMVVDAIAEHQSVAEAQSGATGGTAVTPVVAVTYIGNETEARIGTGPRTTLLGGLTVRTDHRSTVQDEASGDAAGSTAALGASASIGVENDSSHAVLARGVDVGRGILVTSRSATDNNTQAVGSAVGAASEEPDQREGRVNRKIRELIEYGEGLIDQFGFIAQDADAPSAETEEGTVNAAAAIAVNLALSSNVATISTGQEVDAVGNVRVIATQAADAHAIADATAVGTDDRASREGVGVAVGINVASPMNHAQVKDANVVASGITVEATSANGDDRNSYSATVNSGAGGQNIGVAGALAVNIAIQDTQAFVTGSASLTTNGEIQLTTDSLSESRATAIPRQVDENPGDEPRSLGVGASFALNVVQHQANAKVEESASLNSARAVSLTVGADDAVFTDTDAGSEGGTSLNPSVAITYAGRNAEASLSSQSEVTVPGTLSVDADQRGTVRTVATGATAGLDTAIGASIAIGVLNELVTSRLDGRIDTGANITANSRASGTTDAVAVSSARGGPPQDRETPEDALDQKVDRLIGFASTAARAVGLEALVADVPPIEASEGPVSIAGALGVNLTLSNAQAAIADGATVTTAADAVLDSVSAHRVQSLADASSVAHDIDPEDEQKEPISIGAAVAVAVNVPVLSADALVQKSVLRARNVAVNSNVSGGDADNKIAGVFSASAISGASSDDIGGVGALGLNVPIIAATSNIASQATVVSDSLILDARNHIENTADAKANVDGDLLLIGVGASAASNIVISTANASLSPEAQINVTGRSGLSSQTDSQVRTTSHGGLNAGDGGVAGSVTFSAITETTTASIGENAQVNQDAKDNKFDQTVDLNANSNTRIVSRAGVLTDATIVGVGAGADTGRLAKTTQAFVAPSAQVASTGDIALRATSLEDLTSISATSSAGNSARIAGSAAVFSLDITTLAMVGEQANVHANGNILLSADDDSEVDVVAGPTTDVKLLGSIGASIAAPVIHKRTEAYIDKLARVTARAEGEEAEVQTGEFDVRFIDESNSIGEVSLPQLPSIPFVDTSFTEQRTATPKSTTIRGLAITATSRDDIETMVVGAGLSGGLEVESSNAALVTSINTSAHVVSEAVINADDPRTENQTVHIAAGSDLYHLGIVGIATAAGLASVGPAVSLALIDLQTDAFVGAAAQVRAARDIHIAAHSVEDILSFAVGFAGSSAFSSAGSLPVNAVTTRTRAFVDERALVHADGNVRVEALDHTESLLAAGSATLGLVIPGVNATLGITLLQKDTEAFIATNASVDALANRGHVETLKDFHRNTERVKGVVVQAFSSEGVFAATAGGSLGYFGGVAGAATTTIIDSDTTASIHGGARVNTTFNAEGSEQSVYVTAVNDSHATTIAGGLVRTEGAGLPGSVDLGIVRNDTTASILDGAVVDARQDVNVVALANKSVDSFALSAKGGGLGVAGSIGILSIGTILDQESRRFLVPVDDSDADNPDFASVNLFVDAQLNQLSNLVETLLTSYADSDLAGSIFRFAGQSADNNTPDSPVTTYVNNTEKPTGTIAIIDGATVNAGRNVRIHADEGQTSNVTSGAGASGGGSIAAGVALANVDSRPQVYLQGSANVTAGDNFEMQARAIHALDASGYVPTVGGLASIGYTSTIAGSNAVANVGGDASVTASNAVVTAENNSSFFTGSKAFGFQTSGPAGVGATITVSNYDSTATSTVHGRITSSGDTTIDAKSVNETNATRGSASIKDPFENKLFDVTLKIVDAFSDDIAGFLLNFRPDGVAFAGAAAVVLANSNNTASASVGPAGIITSGADLTVTASAIDNFRVSSTASAGNADVASIGGALAVTDTSNEAHALLEDGAVVDVVETTLIQANATVPNQVDIFGLELDLNDEDEEEGWLRIAEEYDNLTDWGNAFIEALELIVFTDSALADGVATTLVHSGGSLRDGGVVGVAGGVNVLEVNNRAHATIGPDAKVNLKTETPSVRQTVVVDSNARVETINMAGQVSAFNLMALGAGAEGATGATGGSFDRITYHNTANSWIDDRAEVVAANDINVNADTFDYLLILGQAGADAKRLGVSGTIGLAEINDTTQAWIEDEAKVTAGNDVNVLAESDITTFNGSGGLTMGGNIGVGISASFNDINNSTKAFVGDANESRGAMGTVEAQNDVNITARSNHKDWAVSLSGTFSSGADFGTGGEQSSNGVSFGFGISGDVSFNHIVDNTQAFIPERARIDAKNSLNVNATSTAFTATGAGGVGYGDHSGIAGSFSHAIVDKTVYAFIRNANVSASTVNIDAASNDLALTVSAGGSGFSDMATLGGSVNQNEIKNDVQAFLLSDTAKSFATDVNITADNFSLVMSVAGGLAVQGHVAIGGALDLNTFENSVLAYISGDVSVGGELEIDATNTNALRSADATFAATDEQGITTALTIASVQSTSNVQAYIAAQSQVAVEGSLYVTADDTNDFVVIAGNAAGSKTVGLGGSSTTIAVDRTVQAYLAERANATARGLGEPTRRETGLIVSAASRDNIVNFAAGGAVAEQPLATDGSFATTALRGTTEAFADQGVSINLDQAELADRSKVRIKANYGGGVFSVSGGFAGSEGLGVGASVSTNDRSVSVRAFVEGANVQGNDVEVLASSDAQLTALSVGGTGAEKLAVEGAISLNTVLDTIVSLVSDQSAVSATRALTVAAADRTGVFSLSGAVTGAGTTSFGASLGRNSISSAVQALVHDADVTAGTATSLSATSDSVIDAITVGGSFSEKLAIAGSVSLNTIDNLIDTHVSGDSSSIAAETVQLDAEDSAQIRALAGSVAGAGTGAVGAALAGNTIADRTTAFVESANVAASQELQLMASSSAIISSATAGGAGAEKFALGGAVSVNNIANTNEARVARDATASAGIDVRLTSRDRAAINSLAGAVAGAGTATIGLANATNTIANTNRAFVEDAQIDSSGSIALATQGNTVINTLAAGGGGAGKAAVHGSLAMNNIGNTLDAHLDQSAAVNAADDVKVTVRDDSEIVALADTITGAGVLSANASAATNQIANNLSATILDAQVTTLGGNVLVSTNTDDTIRTEAAGVGGAGKVSLTGGVSLNTIDNTLISRLAPQASIQGAEDVSILATDQSTIQSLSGQAGGAKTVGVGTAASYNEIENTIHAIIDSTPLTVGGDLAVQSRSDTTIQTLSAGGNGAIIGGAGSVSINLMENDVQAYVTDATIVAGDNISVLAELDDSIQAYGGTAGIGLIGVGGSSVTNLLDNNTLAYTKNSIVVVRGEGEGRSIKNWSGANVAEKPENMKGLSVIASSTESLDVIAVTGTVGGVGLGANVIFNRVNDSTEAFVDSTAINNSRDRGQSVIVRAHQSTDIGSNGGTIAGNVTGLGFADDTSLITNTTRAFMEDSDTTEREPIFAADLDVATFTLENIQSNTVTGGIATAVQKMGSVSVMDIASTSDAFLNEVNVVSDDTLSVRATDHARAHAMTGSLAGAPAGGAGGSLAVGYVANTTRAHVMGSETTAGGETLVEANSTESIQDLVGSAGAGGASGVAGTVAVSFIGSVTEATIDEATIDEATRNSSINQNASSRSENQDVIVRATDTASIVSGVGTVGGSIILEMAGSLDVPTIRNIVNATIGADVSVQAGGDVEVSAITGRSIDSKVLSLGGGGLGLTGALSIAAIGGGLDEEGTSQISDQVRQTLNDEISLMGGVPNLNVDHPLAREVVERTQLDRFTIDVPFGTDAPSADTSAQIGRNASIVAGGDVTVRSESDSLVDIASGLAGLNALSAGGSVGLASIDSNTVATVAMDVQINAGQRVNVSADTGVNSTHVRTTAGQGGAVGIGASVSKLDSDSDARAIVDDRAVISQAERVDVVANRSATLNAVSLGGDVGGVVIGAVVSSAKETGSTEAYIASNVRIGEPRNVENRFEAAVGHLEIAATAQDDVTSHATAGAIGLIPIAGADSDSRAEGAVQAYLGDNAEVYVDGDVRVIANSEASADADAVGLKLSGATVGGSTADAFVSTDVDAYFGAGTQVSAGRDVVLRGIHNYRVIEAQDGETSAIPLSRDAEATSNASEGSLVAGSVTLANGHSMATTDTYLGKGAQVDAGDSLIVQSFANNDGHANAHGTAVGVAGAGAVVADARSQGTAQAYLSEDSNVSVGSDLKVEVITDDTATADATVSTGEITAGRGAEAQASANPTHRAFIAGNVTVNVGRDGQVHARTDMSAEADASGNAIQGAGFGATLAEAIIAGSSDAYVESAHIAVDRNWFVEAIASNDARAEVTGASAGIVQGTNNRSIASIDSTTAAYVNNNATIDANGEVNIVSQVNNITDAKADGSSLGAVEFNATETDSTIVNRNQAYTGRNAAIRAGGDLAMSAHSDNHIARSEAIGAESGFLGNAVTHARSTIDDQTTATVGSGSNLTAIENVLIEALSSNEAHSVADTTTLNAVSFNSTIAETVAKAAAFVEIGDNSTVVGDEARIHAKVMKLDVDADSGSETTGLDSTSNARSSIDVDSDTDIVVRAGSTITGCKLLEILARQENVDTDSDAQAMIAAGLTGVLEAEAQANVDLDSDIIVESGSTLVTDELVIEADAPGPEVYSRTAVADAETVVNLVAETITETKQGVTSVTVIGPVIGWVVCTTTDLVTEELHSDESAIVSGAFTSDSSVTLDGDVLPCPQEQPTLIVAADGRIVESTGIEVVADGNQLILRPIINEQANRVIISAVGGPVRGRGTIALRKAFSNVTIVNHSASDLVVADIRSLFVNDRLPDIQITTGHDETEFTIVSALDSSQVTIENNSTGNVILQGLLTNPIGTMQITSQLGDIVAVDGHLLQANQVSLSAVKGEIGNTGTAVNIELVQNVEDARLEVLAGTDVFVEMAVVEFLDELPTEEVTLDRVDLSNLRAGGDIQLVQKGAQVRIPSPELGVAPRTLDVGALPTLKGIVATSVHVSGPVKTTGEVTLSVSPSGDALEIDGALNIGAGTNLELTSVAGLDAVGDSVATVLKATTITGRFASAPGVGQHLGAGTFVHTFGDQGPAFQYSGDAIEIALFQAAAGDTDGDREFNQLDIVRLLRSGKYLSGERADWTTGDWTGDGVFNQSDIVAALLAGHYLDGRYAATGSSAVLRETHEVVERVFREWGTR